MNEKDFYEKLSQIEEGIKTTKFSIEVQNLLKIIDLHLSYKKYNEGDVESLLQIANDITIESIVDPDEETIVSIKHRINDIVNNYY